jgi:hypothetical protein
MESTKVGAEDLFDRVPIGRVFCERDRLGAGCAYEAARGVAFLAAEIGVGLDL